MSQQETATDRLVSIIQAIQLAQGSGVLSVRRGKGRTLEEGRVVFVNGQVTRAVVGRRSDKTALNWLSTWGRCWYTFVPASGGSRLPTTPAPVPETESSHDMQANSQPRNPISPLRRPAEQFDLLNRSSPETPLPELPSSNRVMMPAAVPFPVYGLDEALQRMEKGSLSRSHRQLFLLVDGQRSTLELARLVGKRQEEVYGLLRDLDRLGIIQLGGN